MSLINDALKRAKQIQRPRPPVPSGDLSLQPHDHRRASSKWLILIVVAAVGVLGFFGWRTYFGNGADETAAGPPSVQPQAPDTRTPATSATNQSAGAETVPGEPALAMRPGTDTGIREPIVEPPPVPPVVPANSPSELANGLKPPATDDLGTGQPSPTNTVIGPPAPNGPASGEGTFPELKLQGIYYRLTKPSVLIEGKTFFLNDTIKGARIIEIHRNEVLVEWNGEKRTLTLARD